MADSFVAGRAVEPIHRSLLEWYCRHQRDLPWRQTADPYAILVSEVMLQQTQVERVLPKYREWLEAFPTLEALAAAPRAEVIRRWAPLGYNLRAVRLHEIARQAVEQFGGRLPATAAGLQQLKGLGPYTAGAVACFGFRQRTPILDTNVRRVLGRVFDGADLGRTPAAERRGWALANATLPDDDYYDWNQALMDLGATICTARKPACLICPLREQCCYASRVAGTGEVGVEANRVDRSSLGSRNGAGKTGLEYGVTARSESRAAERRAAYRATPFEGSNRYFRGRIVDALRARPAGSHLAAAEIGSLLKPAFDDADLPWLEGLLAGLERDGLVSTDRTGGALMVRLPD